MSHVFQLEAFESSIRGRRVRWFIAPGSPSIYPPGFQEQIYTDTPPFVRKILITCHTSSEAWKLTERWDSILLPSTPTDWSLVLTLVINQPSPTLIVCSPEVRIPLPFFQKCNALGNKAPTIICLQHLSLPLPPAAVTFDATFFPPTKAVDDTLMEAMQNALQNLISADKISNFVVKDALKDLRGAGATLVISAIEDPDPSLYWYYASETKSKGKDLLSSVVYTLLNRS
jgi:hypothetical protein